MPKQAFLTISEDLLAVALAIEAHFRALGYTIKREPHQLGFPYTPALTAKRATTTLIVEVSSIIDGKRLDQWTAYCRSCSSDTRIAFTTLSGAKISTQLMQKLGENRAGLYIVDGINATEMRPPQDLSININWPDMAGFSAGKRKMLGPAKERFDRGEWREAFEECCEIFENKAKANLSSGISSGRIAILNSKGKVQNPTRNEIRKATIGRLRTYHSKIRNKNHKDAIIENVLSQINPERVEYTHRRKHKRTETSLRRNAGKHIWTVVMTLKDL